MSIFFSTRRALAAALVLTLAAAPAAAHEVTIGALKLTDLWSRATPPKAPTAAGYLTISNEGTEADTLVSVSSPIAEKSEIHLMETTDGVMTMKPVEGVTIEPGETVDLKPGGYHLMFIGLKEGVTEGGNVAVTLTFEKAGSVETFLHGMAIGSKGPKGDAGGEHHDHGAHDSHESHDAHGAHEAGEGEEAAGEHKGH